jgi:hypothetical protein
VPSDSVATFSSAVTAEKSHSMEAFTAVNQLMADASLDYAAKQPTLSEANFTAGLDQNGLQVWEEAFEKLERYAQHLQTLTSPELSKDFEDQSVNLAGDLQAFGDRLQKEGAISQAPKFDPTLAAGFTELGSLVIRLKAQSDAKRVLIGADPHIREVLLGMAGSIGGSTAEGVRGTVKTHWNMLLAEKKLDFLEAQDLAKRREVAAAFQSLLLKRAAEDSALLSLHDSLISLADLHHALATGEAWSARKTLDVLSDEMTRTTELKASFQQKVNK